MAKIIIIGGSGHVGTYLVPRLVRAGHHVINVARGDSRPYTVDAAWSSVETVRLDRDAEEAAGAFGAKIAALEPDVVVDMISFKLESTQPLVKALRGSVRHFLHCGTIWVYGHNAAVPAVESDPLNPFGEYGTQKAAIETWLLDEARQTGFPATVFRPGHIVGPGWNLVGPTGNINLQVFETIARGEELVLPNFGMETVHHVHADDVAQQVVGAIDNWSVAVGEAFNTVSAQALNIRGYSEAMYRFFGHEPKLRYEPFDSWKRGQSAEDAETSWGHIIRSPNHSIAKAERLLGYRPRYTSLEAIFEAVRWLVADGQIRTR